MCSKKIKVSFDAPDLSSNGGLLLVDALECSFLDKIAQLIPDYRNQLFIVHSQQDMIRQRVGQIICGYEDANDCDFDYKAASWKYAQRVVAKIEVNLQGTNIRFVVTSNRNNTPQTIYRRYCGRGQMELWIKDLKYLKSTRMSSGSFRAKQFRLFLYGLRTDT